MKLFSSLVILSAAALPCLAETVKVTYNTLYDNPNWYLDNTACSNGANGLAAKWPILGDIPNYPFVGGVPGLTWDSTLCGTCWQLSYTDGEGNVVSANITAVDASTGEFDITETAFYAWAGSIGVGAGSVNATAVQVSPSSCGIN